MKPIATGREAGANLRFPACATHDRRHPTCDARTAFIGRYGSQLDVILDLTPMLETRVKAMHCMEADLPMCNYYMDVARRRGTQGGRNSGKPGD